MIEGFLDFISSSMLNYSGVKVYSTNEVGLIILVALGSNNVIEGRVLGWIFLNV